MKNWYAIECKIRDEFKVNQRLKFQGYESYLPVTKKDKRYLTTGATVKPILIALFPRYLFVRMNEGTDDFHPITKTPGVSRIVRMSRRDDGYLYPTVMPDYLISSMRSLENAQGIHLDYVKVDYEKGDDVRVVGGPFIDFPAEVVDLPGEERAVILVSIFNRLTKVEVDYTQIVPA